MSISSGKNRNTYDTADIENQKIVFIIYVRTNNHML